MPNAGTHDAITVVTGMALVPLSYTALLNYGQFPEAARLDAAVLVGAHLLSGIMFSPDLDIDSKIDDRWGPFYWIWRPYMWVVPHGSRSLSHGLVIPPLLRLLYFLVVSMLTFLSMAWLLGQIGVIVPDYHLQVIHYLEQLARTQPREVLAFLVGFITGSAAHSLADSVTTYHKGRRHR